MFKSLIAATAAITCCLGGPAMASVGAAFDQATTKSKGDCYETSAGHTVCYQLIKPREYSISLIQKDNNPAYATTLYLRCGGRWEAYGPADQQNVQALADAFCEEQGY